MVENKRKAKPIYPMLVVLASISLIEVAMTFLYPKLQDNWERIPVLFLITAIPLSIVATFVYLWIKRPGNLYPPSEFGSGKTAEAKLSAYA